MVFICCSSLRGHSAECANYFGKYMDGPFTAYILLTLLPVILLVGPLALVLSLVELSKNNFFHIILICIIAIEIFVLTLFILIKINISPGSPLKKRGKIDKKLLMLDCGRRLLRYSIYAWMLYFVPIISLVVYIIIENRGPLGYIVTHPQQILGALILSPLFLLLFPHLAIPVFFISIAASIIVTGIVILAAVVLVMSMNATIRLLYASERIREKRVLYIILMILPVANIICMFYLCRLAKKEMKRANVLDSENQWFQITEKDVVL